MNQYSGIHDIKVTSVLEQSIQLHEKNHIEIQMEVTGVLKVI